MEIAVVGLGKMGANMARRLARGGVQVSVFDREPAPGNALQSEPRVRVCDSLASLLGSLAAPRILWSMLPAGDASQSLFDDLRRTLVRGDLLVDGANAQFRDSQRQAQLFGANGIDFVDVGVSGGLWGLKDGYGLMVGGSGDAVRRLTPFLQILAPAATTGWVHCGPCGAGHYAKMVHNAIEYGLMQAYAEGLSLLEARKDLVKQPVAVAEAWRHGTVIRSWLLDLLVGVLRDDKSLASIAPVVADSGEGRWAAAEAIALGIPTPVLIAALQARFESQGGGAHAAKLLAALRQAFGGHEVQRNERLPA